MKRGSRINLSLEVLINPMVTTCTAIVIVGEVGILWKFESLDMSELTIGQEEFVPSNGESLERQAEFFKDLGSEDAVKGLIDARKALEVCFIADL